MIKKYLNYLLVGLMLFLPLKLDASSLTLSLACPDKVNAGQAVTCTLSAVNVSEVTGVQGNISVTDAEFKGFTASSEVVNYSIDGSRVFQVGKTSGFGSSVTIGTISIQIPGDATSASTYTVSISGVVISDMDMMSHDSTGTSKVIGINSTVNTLSSLTISGVSDLNFSPDVTTYSATVDSDTVTIDGTLTDNSSRIDGDGFGTKTLNYGLNVFKISVISESGDVKTYTINITRPEPPKQEEENNGGNNPGNNNNNNNNNSNNNNNNSGNNNNSNNNTNTKSSNKNLSKLVVNDGEIKLVEDQVEYKLTVNNDVETVNISYVTEDSKATVKVEGNTTLVEGENTISIIVTAEDGSTKTYILKVTRAHAGEVVSTNNYLKSLTIDGYAIKFDKNIIEYDIKIKREKKLNIEAIAEDEKSTVKIVGNNNLENGSQISILVTAEDGTTRTYLINVQNINSLFNSIALAIVGAVILIAVIIILIVKKKKSKNVIHG